MGHENRGTLGAPVGDGLGDRTFCGLHGGAQVEQQQVRGATVLLARHDDHGQTFSIDEGLRPLDAPHAVRVGNGDDAIAAGVVPRHRVLRHERTAGRLGVDVEVGQLVCGILGDLPLEAAAV